MPFKSEAQRRLFWAKVDEGEISKATAKKWEKETGNKDLPEKVKKSAYLLGVEDALNKYGEEVPEVLYKVDPDLASRWVYRGSRLMHVPTPISYPMAQGVEKALEYEQRKHYGQLPAPQSVELEGQPEQNAPETQQTPGEEALEPGETRGEAEGQEFGQQILPKQPLSMRSDSAKEEIGKIL